MTATTKFEIGTEVYHLSNGMVTLAVIKSIDIRIYNDGTEEITYHILTHDGDFIWVDEGKLFTSRQEILDYITKQIEDLKAQQGSK